MPARVTGRWCTLAPLPTSLSSPTTPARSSMCCARLTRLPCATCAEACMCVCACVDGGVLGLSKGKERAFLPRLPAWPPNQASGACVRVCVHPHMHTCMHVCTGDTMRPRLHTSRARAVWRASGASTCGHTHTIAVLYCDDMVLCGVQSDERSGWDDDDGHYVVTLGESLGADNRCA